MNASGSPKRPNTSMNQQPPAQNGPTDYEHEKLQQELEHHKNLLIGLNEKLTVFNDLKQDLDSHKTMTHKHEVAREELQAHIAENAQAFNDHAADGKSYQDTLIQENSNLKTLIQALEAKAAQALNDYNASLKAQNEAHIQKENQNIEQLNALKIAHTTRVN